MAVETPAYEVVRHDGPFELRRYEGYVTASVRVAASGYGRAANAGFNSLADYIFGNNRESDRIEMTAPVTAGRTGGRKIAMTAPVTATPAEDEYVVSFTMPAEYSMEDLPLPNNSAVTLASVGAHVAAAIRFSGYFSDKSASQATAELEEWMRKQGLTPAGEPVAAQYDAPWKPWFARRNEIMIPVEAELADLH
jgi:hypothetical protein